MENNEPETVSSLEPSSGEASQDASQGSKASHDADDIGSASTEALLHNLMQDVGMGEGEVSITEKAKGDQIEEAIDIKPTTKESTKETTSHQPPRHLFHLSDSMKKGLSMLAYPSKTPSRKKGITTSSRSTPNLRITIGEALEKAQDVRNTMSNIPTNVPKNSKGNILASSTTDRLSSDVSVVNGEKESQRMVSAGEEVGILSSAKDSGAMFGEKENVLNKDSVTSQNMSAESSISDSLATTSSEGKREPLAGKAKPPSTSRLKLTPRMGELLKFTFTHEHFPASVHMARLAKMMGIQWSQIRNWFTDRRVANKRAGLFPRDKALVFCPHCEVSLKTESEQKNHLFSFNHVKKLLGPEYAGPAPTTEAIKWKQLPRGVNAVSKNSGARILAIGYPKDKYGVPIKDKKTETLSQKQMDPVSKENASHSEKLQKLWTNSVLQDKMEKGPENKLVQQFKGKFGGGYNGHRQTEIKINLDSTNPNDEEKNAMKLSDDNDEIFVAATKKLHISNQGISSLMAEGHAHEPHPGDPCSSNSNREVEVTATKPSNEEPEIMYKISRRGHIIPSITVRSGNLAKLPSSLSDSPGVCNSTEASSLETSGNGKAAISKKKTHPEGEITEDQDVICESPIVPRDETIIKQEIILEEAPSSSSSSSNYTTSKIDSSEHQLIKIENPMFQNASRASTSSQRWSPYPGAHASKGHMQQSTGPMTARLYAAKEGYKPQEASSINRILQHSGMKRTYQGRQSPQTGLSTVRTSRFRSTNEENIMLGYQCPTCSKIFQTEWLMIKHSLSHLKYQCYICDQIFTTECTLKYHLIDHLAGAYEDEKYYCQFSCKTCHSLKCECFEPTYCKPRELPKRYQRPQKARRTKKTFINKLDSGLNDHLKINMSDYKKLFHRPTRGENVGRVKSSSFIVNNSNPLVQKLEAQTKLSEETTASSDPKPDITFIGKETGTPDHTIQSSSITREGTPVQNKLPNLFALPLAPTSSQTSIEDELESIPLGKRHAARRKPNKLSNNYVYKDADFYYMCEICDASFLSKAELSEHMFFHRLKSRSRRGEKRGHSSIVEDDTAVLKRVKVEPFSKTKIETITVGGFERFKCPMCKGHFASITDLNRHRTQAHKTPDSELSPSINASPQIIEVLQCVYCDKLYRRDRELRRHLKHDCCNAPKSLKESLSPGVTLDEEAGGPHYRIVKRNVDEHFLNEPGTSKSHTKSNQRGPITCKYCLLVTKREAEMKRHVWKYCPRIPKEIVKQFKNGTSLEQLGFKYGSPIEASKNPEPSLQEAKDMKPPCTSMETDSNTTQCHVTVLSTSPSKSLPEDSQSPASSPLKSLTQCQAARVQISLFNTSSQPSSNSPSFSSVKSLPSPVMSIPVPLPMITGAKSRHPLVCGYCGIWYFREQAILKHMKERCIRLPPYEKEILINGARLCNVPQEKSVSVSLAPGSVATYKMVEVPEHIKQNLPLHTIDSVSNKDIKMITSEVHESLDNNPVESPSKTEPSTPLASTQLYMTHVETTPVNSPVNQRIPITSPVTQSTSVKSPETETLPTSSVTQISPITSSENTPVKPPVNPTTPVKALVGRPRKKGGRKPNSVSSRGSRCRRCHEHFETQDAVLAHSSVHHGPKKGLYKCKLCLIKVPKYKQLREHIWEHTNETPYRCHFCLVKYRSSDILIEHLQTQHDYNVANERNLYKWLPKRNGKYREIKSPDKNLEESLDDVEATLDSMAEVLVISDSDICSMERAQRSTKKSEKDAAKETLCKDEDKASNNQEKRETIQGPEDTGSAPEEKTSELNVDEAVGAKNLGKGLKQNKIQVEASAGKKNKKDNQKNVKNTMEKSTTKLKKSVGRPKKNEGKRKNTNVERKNKCNNDGDSERGKEASGPSDQGAGQKGGSDTNNTPPTDNQQGGPYNNDKDTSLDDIFNENGEGLLTNVDNLESVIETIHLTDKHLS